LPITGSTPKKCFEEFRAHLDRLLKSTVRKDCPVLVEATTGNRAQLGFRQGKSPIAIPVRTRHGRLFFAVTQLVEAKRRESEGDYKLTTLTYWYRLQTTGDYNAQALIRWEYDRTLRTGPKPCRHHVQQQTTIAVSHGEVLDMNKLHLPTGWVVLEEVIRFLIHDLGVRPPCGNDWHKAIEDSEKAFRESFSTQHD
jgi:hypothetical protein